MTPCSDQPWLAIVQGNTHQQWGWFTGKTLEQVDRFPASQALPFPQDRSIWVASVGETVLPDPWLESVHLLSLESLPLSGTYATLGIDRALAVLAAGHRYGWPALVVDAGTALTVSAADPTGTFVGGAILPGLGLQAHALHQATAALPLIRWSDPGLILPPRWARETDQAIESGILYTVLAGVREFWQEWQATFPHSSLLLTGGDGSILWQHFNQDPDLADRLYLDPYLVLYGIAECRNASSSV